MQQMLIFCATAFLCVFASFTSSSNPMYKFYNDLSQYENLAHTAFFASGNNLRHGRSIEGAPCNNSSTTPATGVKQAVPQKNCSPYPYTYCNANGQCVCNSKLAVRLELLPGYTFCLPMQYAVDTQRCLPTEPDICSLAFPGSKCVFLQEVDRRASAGLTAINSGFSSSRQQPSFSAASGTGEWRCQCAINKAGALNSCQLYVGMSCTNNASICTGIGQQPGQVSTVECNSTVDSDLYATCVCSLGTEQSRDRLRCMARQCPRRGTTAPSPCRGSSYECYSPGQPQYLAGSGRFYCTCRDVGVNHSESVDGLCCELGSMPCADFSTCINQTSLCNGVRDCADCSDEELRICARPLPNDTMCVRPVNLRINSFMDSSPADMPPAMYNDLSNQSPFPARDDDDTTSARMSANINRVVEKNVPKKQQQGYDRLVPGNNILSPKLDAPAEQFVLQALTAKKH